MAQCKACNTELPKNAKLCPKCGTKVYVPPKNVRVLAIVGAVMAFLGGLLPFVQNSENVADAYSYMSYLNNDGYQYQNHQTLWYLYMVALIATIIIVVLKKEIFSIITTAIAAIIFGITFSQLTSFMNEDPVYTVGLGTYVVVLGLIIAVVGCFFDILKFRKTVEYDTRYMTNNKSTWSKMVYHKWFYVMFIPVVVFIAIFNYWPMLGVRYAFTDYKRVPVYVGIKHFAGMVAKDPYFWRAFWNTLQLSVIKLVLNTGMAVIISLLLHEITNIWFKKTVQTIIYLPHFMSWVVVASIFRMLLDTSDAGMINTFLMNANLVNEPVYFMGSVEHWRGVYYIVNIWRDTGWGTILFLATLSGISPELYEAAEIDGANRFNKMRYITLPALANTIITVFILNLAKVMNLFESVFVLMNDAVISVADVIQTYIYRMSFSGGNNYGYTTAVGLFKSLVGCVLVLICDYASKKVRGRGIV
ncbi:MAG: ABC transporter permease subunit [Lachnospiraceae bacterium]|nr:ABC transporter permease subunit [Lachnospiraceae bacterium]